MEEDDGDMEQQRRRDAYLNPNNSNNMTMCLRMLDPLDHEQLQNSSEDGHTYCFLTEAKGPVLSVEALETLFALDFIQSFAPNSDRVLKTKTLHPRFHEGRDKVKTLSKLEEVKQCDPVNVLTMIENRHTLQTIESFRDIASGTWVQLPPPGVEEDDADEVYHTRQVPLCDVYLAPVRVTGGQGNKVFWLVMARTRRCFDFLGHIQDIYESNAKQLASSTGKRGRDEASEGLEIVRKVLLRMWKMSPAARAHFATAKELRQEPWDFLGNERVEPISFDQCGSIFEVVRGLLNPIDLEDSTAPQPGELFLSRVSPKAHVQPLA